MIWMTIDNFLNALNYNEGISIDMKEFEALSYNYLNIFFQIHKCIHIITYKSKMHGINSQRRRSSLKIPPTLTKLGLPFVATTKFYLMKFLGGGA